MKNGSIAELFQSSQVSNEKYAARMLEELEEIHDQLNAEIESQLQTLRGEAALRHLSHFLYRYGMLVAFSGHNIEQIVLYIAFKQQQFDEESAELLIAVCRQLYLFELCPENTIQLIVNDNLTFLNLLQRAESYIERGLRATDVELVLYLNIGIPLPEQLFETEQEKDVQFLLKAYRLSHNKINPGTDMLSDALKDLLDTMSLETPEVFVYASILCRELRLTGRKEGLEPSKFLMENLREIKECDVELVYKLLLLSELVEIENEGFHCKACMQVFNLKEFRPSSGNDEILLYKIASSTQRYYLLQNQCLSKLPYIPIASLQEAGGLFTRMLDFLKESKLDMSSLALMVEQACYFIGLGIMEPDISSAADSNILADIIDYVKEEPVQTLNSTTNILTSVLLILLNTMLYESSRGLSELMKHMHAQLVQYVFQYITYSPVLHAYLQLHILLHYLDYSQKLALLEVAEIVPCGVLASSTFYRQVVYVSAGEQTAKLREYVVLKERYNILVDEYNRLAESRPSQLTVIPKEEDVEQEIAMEELERNFDEEHRIANELKTKLENFEIEQAEFEDERKSLLQQIDSSEQINGVLKDELALAQDRLANEEEELALLKMELAESAKEAENSRDSLEKSEENVKMMKEILETVESVLEGTDFK